MKNKPEHTPARSTGAKPMNDILKRLKQEQDGLTLIDAAILLLVVGILTTPLIQAYNVWHKSVLFQDNIAKFNTTADAIDNYYFANDRYPCPADPALGPDDPDYGTASKDNNGTCLLPRNPDGVIIGAIPFKDLKMTPQEALDSYGNKLAYAVTADLADPSVAFNNNGGQIRVLRVPDMNQDGECDNAAPIDTGRAYHFLFFSRGPNGRGAFKESGDPTLEDCQPNNGGPHNEIPNCRPTTTTFIDSYCMLSQAPGSNAYYDDQFYDSYTSDYIAPSRIWDNADDPQNLGAKGLLIGVGTKNPRYELDVMGNLRATAKNPTDPNAPVGNALAGSYCTDGTDNCFRPSVIAGDEPEMTCTSDRAMSGIRYSEADCIDTVSNIPAQTCPEGQYAIGIDAGGNITCGAAP